MLLVYEPGRIVKTFLIPPSEQLLVYPLAPGHCMPRRPTRRQWTPSHHLERIATGSDIDDELETDFFTGRSVTNSFLPKGLQT